MNITYTRDYSQVMVANEGSMTDVVKTFYCNITGIDSVSNISSTAGFYTQLSLPDSNTFINFTDLTTTILDSWVDASTNVAQYETAIAESIDKIVNPVITQKKLPWQSE